MTTKDFGMGFFGRNPFDKEARKMFQEKWATMTDNEKLEFMSRKMEMHNNPEKLFSVEAIDARCEKWMKKTPEEKEKWVNEKKEAFHHRAFFGGHFHAHRNFDPSFCEGQPSMNKD